MGRDLFSFSSSSGVNVQVLRSTWCHLEMVNHLTQSLLELFGKGNGLKVGRVDSGFRGQRYRSSV